MSAETDRTAGTGAAARPDRGAADGAGRRVRLAVVSDAVQPFHTGGKEARYAAILPRLGARGIDVEVHTMKWWPQRRRRLVVDGLTMRALSPLVSLYTGTRRSVWQAVVFAVCSLRMLGRRFDVLEVDAIPFLQIYPLWAVARLRRRPLVVTWHEVWGREYWSTYLGPVGVVAAWLERTAARLPDAIIAASQETGDRVTELSAGRARVTVVPAGIDPAEIRGVVPRPGVGQVLCVGRLLAHKNVDLVIEAVAVLRQQGRDLRLTVIGQGPEAQRLRALAAARGIADSVEFLDPLPERRDLLGAMAGASVLAFPSVREGFGMVALEALATGLPVVTADHPDNFSRRLVTDGVTGRVCPPTTEALAQALADVLDRGPQMAEQAAASVAEYDWDHLASRVAQVIREVA